MFILYVIAAVCLIGYILIIKDFFKKQPPLTPEEEEMQRKRMEQKHCKDMQVLHDTAKDISFGATIVGLGLLNEALKSEGKNKKGK